MGSDDKTLINDPPKLIGTTLDGRYHVEELLGQGGFGEVYLARDKPEVMSRRVVIKVLQEKALQDEYILTKFRHEIEALTRIDDPGVVGVLDAGHLPNGHPYLVMQFVEGKNLRTQIRSDRGMDFDDVAQILQQIGSTLTAAHENEVIHRDLKPENIMARRRPDGTWQVKVIDFGIAKIRHSVVAPSSITGRVAGTVGYMSPEQLEGRKVTAASDVYALGAIAYEMVTGRLPFNPETPYQLNPMQKAGVQMSPTLLRPALPVAAQESILKALSYQEADRYQRARDFGETLARALGFSEEPTWNKPTEIGDSAAAGDRANAKARVSEVSTMESPSRGNDFKALPPKEQLETPVRNLRSRRRLWLAILGALLLMAMFGGVAWRYVLKTGPVESTTAEFRNLSFFLNVEMKNSGTNSYSAPFPSTGTEVLNNGSKISFHIEVSQDGFLYIVNEGPGQNGSKQYNILFPNPKDNNGSARLAAGQKLDTYSFPLDENEGTEIQWIVWAARAVPQLESTYRAAFPEKGRVLDSSRQQSLKILLEQQKITAPQTTRQADTTLSRIIGSSAEIWAFPIEISHRRIDYR